jgi:hypothetical protein
MISASSSNLDPIILPEPACNILIVLITKKKREKKN